MVGGVKKVSIDGRDGKKYLSTPVVDALGPGLGILELLQIAVGRGSVRRAKLKVVVGLEL